MNNHAEDFAEQFWAALFVIVALAFAPPVSGHHSVAGLYDSDRVIEIEGVVHSVSWRNPHTHYTIKVVQETGETVEWRIEGGSLGLLRTRGLVPGFVQVGDQVKIAGDSSRRGLPEMFAHNMLLENGQEVLLTVRAQPRWAGDLLQPTFDEATAEKALGVAEGIFRVWSTVLGDPASFPMFKTDDCVGSSTMCRSNYPPLTEAAQTIYAEWGLHTNPFLGCEPKGVPNIMDTPLPIEFVRQGDNILLRLEEHDTERLIHMSLDHSVRPASYSAYGFSTGRWEGSSLVVQTTNIDTPYLTINGTPQSREISLVERFSVNESEDQLDYTILITDPMTFTEPFELTRYLIWKPEILVRPFECQE